MMKDYLELQVAMNIVILKDHLIYTPKPRARCLEKMGVNVAQFWQAY